MRPRFKVPSVDHLSNGLLDRTYNHVNKIANAYLDSTEYASIVIDGWTNIRRDAIINIIAINPSPIFLKSVDTKGIKKDANYMFALVDQVIQELNPTKVTALISDNENKMNALAVLVQKKYKHIIFNGCAAHKLNTMLREMYRCPAIKSTIDSTKDIVYEIRSHHALLARYRELVNEDTPENSGELNFYSDTRFAGSIMMLQSYIRAIKYLSAMASDSKCSMSHDAKMRILSIEPFEKFNESIEHCALLFQPISDCIHKIEADGATLADLIHQIKLLEKSFITNIPILNRDERKQIDKCFENTKDAIKTPSAMLAYILNPSYIGCSLTSDEKMAALMFLSIYGRQLDLNEEQKRINESYKQYINKEGYFAKSVIWSFDISNPISWWRFIKLQSDHSLLADIALHVLHIQPTNAAIERTFSIQKFLHRKERNRLLGERVNKLMFINCNLRTFDLDPNFDTNNYIIESDNDGDDEKDE